MRRAIQERRRALRVVGFGAAGLLALFVLCAAAWLMMGPPAVADHRIDAAVERDPGALDTAFAQLPVARRYPRPLHAQQNGSLCGPASLVNVLASIGAPVADEGAVLAGSGMCRGGVCWMGLSFDELAALAGRVVPGVVTVHRDLSLEAFRSHMRRSNEPTVRYVVNFHRTPVFGAGGGHHSPIGGYLEATDEVLVLDVNGHYGPWLVPLEQLYAGVDTLDGDATRGLLRVELSGP